MRTDSTASRAVVLDRLARTLLAAVDAPTCAVDDAGVIVAVNRAWERTAGDGGGDAGATGVGVDYLDVCRRAHLDGVPEAGIVLEALTRVLGGDIGRVALDYVGETPTGPRSWTLRVMPLPDGYGALLTHVEIDADQPVPLLDAGTDLRGRRAVAARVRHRVRALHDAGASPDTIAAALNREGVPSPSGARWHRTSVCHQLRALHLLAQDIQLPVTVTFEGGPPPRPTPVTVHRTR